MKTASVQELCYQFAKISRWLKDGQEVKITDRGVPWARIVPLPQAKKP
jgi:antitoxin (DNA-binding transcriptional repressor) of toxin-antitoxin stability system